MMRVRLLRRNNPKRTKRRRPALDMKDLIRSKDHSPLRRDKSGTFRLFVLVGNWSLALRVGLLRPLRQVFRHFVASSKGFRPNIQQVPEPTFALDFA